MRSQALSPSELDALIAKRGGSEVHYCNRFIVVNEAPVMRDSYVPDTEALRRSVTHGQRLEYAL
ncbi:hypothetical protein PILCRDRAFT_329152 [Piloderma croceum F 1598]|uniref:Uncharacterized protein n=1 Tax=Piloderma croceum (strain F 1598) TaxID=765440 RepID=A0A0C3BHY1_PILCF|nr:hypothetical protein PILCRDRAFT_329152 [Piloderma croceum F 1598]